MPKNFSNLGSEEKESSRGGRDGIGALSLISTTYSSSEEEDIELVQVVLNPHPRPKFEPKVEVKANFSTASENLGVPTDFGDVKIKQELPEDVEEKKTIKPDIADIDRNIDSEMRSLENITEPKRNTDSSESNNVCMTMAKVAYRNEEAIGTSDSESDSVITVEDGSSDDADHSESESEQGKKSKKKSTPRRSEFSFNDLPPIEDLHISVPHEKCKLIGTIKSVVDPLVVVESVPNIPVLNLDSVLFLDEGDRALGHIFDVIGNVKEPYYCVRFNSKEHIEKNGVHPGMKVYCAPETNYTAYVFVAQLRQMRGSDASWKDDIEAPPEEQEFSDDDAERMAKNGGRKKKQKQRKATAADGIATENPNQNGFGYSNENSTRRGYKRPQGYNRSSQPQNMDNSYQNFHHTPYVPPYVAGFTPPHAARPPFHRYNHPRPHYQNRSAPGMNNRMQGPYNDTHVGNGYGQFNYGSPQAMSFHTPPVPHYQQEYNMWAGAAPQQNYWQNRNTTPAPVNGHHTPQPNGTSFRSHENSFVIQPPPPGV